MLLSIIRYFIFFIIDICTNMLKLPDFRVTISISYRGKEGIDRWYNIGFITIIFGYRNTQRSSDYYVKKRKHYIKRSDIPIPLSLTQYFKTISVQISLTYDIHKK